MRKKQEPQKGRKGGMNNTTAGAVGAVVGGVVGAAAGIALSDKEKRKMMMSRIDDLKKYIGNALDEIQHMSGEATDALPQIGATQKEKRHAPKKQKRNVN